MLIKGIEIDFACLIITSTIQYRSFRLQSLSFMRSFIPIE